MQYMLNKYLWDEGLELSRLRALAAVAENLSSILSTQMASPKQALTPVPGDVMPPSGFHEHCMHPYSQINNLKKMWKGNRLHEVML